MSYPGIGYVETTYRNPVASVYFFWITTFQVLRFLKERHDGNYMIFNCSERTYDKSKLEFRVKDFNWKDHHAPPLHLLCDFVDKMLAYLKGSSFKVKLNMF